MRACISDDEDEAIVRVAVHEQFVDLLCHRGRQNLIGVLGKQVPQIDIDTSIIIPNDIISIFDKIPSFLLPSPTAYKTVQRIVGDLASC